MKSTVYYIKTSLEESDYYEKIITLLNKSGLLDDITPNTSIPLKIHSHDYLDTPHINKDLLDTLGKMFNKKNNNLQIVDTDTLYHFKNSNSSLDNINIDIDFKGEFIEKELSSNNIPKISILKSIDENESLVSISHFKGHSIIGFSGSLKNIATGCINKDSKIKLHRTIQPIISKIACLSCKECPKYCPEDCISIENTAKIDYDLCTGCYNCITSCPNNAIKINRINSEEYVNLLGLSAQKIIENKKSNKLVFINCLVDIKPYYDFKINDNKLVNDIGILASNDPVAIDKASLDLVNSKKGLKDSALKTNFEVNEDKFKGVWRNVDEKLQLEVAQKLGIGTQEYELITLEE